jgi:hypothetical protein
MEARGVSGATIRTECICNTQVVRYFAVEDSMDDTHGSTCIADGLTKPHYLAGHMLLTQVQIPPLVLIETVILIHTCHRKYEKERMGRSGNERKKLGLGNAVNIVESQGGGKSECLGVLCQHCRIRLKRNPSLFLVRVIREQAPSWPADLESQACLTAC